VFVPVPIIFKGSGFYVTDHRKDGKGKGNGQKDDSTAATKEAPEKTKTEVASKAKD
jgi:predicted nucleic acid-binding Zn ribbon protein